MTLFSWSFEKWNLRKWINSSAFDFECRGWCQKFAPGLNIIIYIVQKVHIWVTRLLFCQNDSPIISGSFRQKDSLITQMLFELSLSRGKFWASPSVRQKKVLCYHWARFFEKLPTKWFIQKEIICETLMVKELFHFFHHLSHFTL